MQFEKIIKRPLLLAVVVTFTAAGSYAVADGITQNESHSDSDMAAQNWDNTNGPDIHAVAPSNDAGMAAETWRTLKQTVSHSNMAAENWGNPDGPDTHMVEPSSDGDMAAENWRETR